MDIRKVETREVKIGTRVRVIWDILDNGFQIPKTGKVIEIIPTHGEFIIEIYGEGKVRINLKSTLWEIY